MPSARVPRVRVLLLAEGACAERVSRVSVARRWSRQKRVKVDTAEARVNGGCDGNGGGHGGGAEPPA